MELIERTWDHVGLVVGGAMRGFERAITSLFGSSNARFLKKLQPKVEAINSLEHEYAAMSDGGLREQTEKFRQRLGAGETLDDLLIEAFALCREGGRRFLAMRHFDVQLMGGMVLHGGMIAEMVTGEGKTLVATLPAYLNALEGKGVHVVTVNDYLARRDMEWMGPLYTGLGLTVGTIQNDMEVGSRQKAYACDITYGTNNEFGFDYLRDNMRPAAWGDDRYPKHLQQSQRNRHFAIIDEVDNILIDEARTPLIISGPAHDNIRKYADADRISRQLRLGQHFEVNEKDHTANLTDAGVREAERLAGVETFYTAGNMEWPHLIDNSLKAHHLYKRDVNYVVKEGRVVIVDEFTGRLMEGRQWSDGLHQAVEAKEGVKIKEETQTLATITLQNFFKLYDKLCGMTGTAMTEAGEFWKIYKLDVIGIPTNKPMRRIENPDVIHCTEEEKYQAIAHEIERLNRWDVLVDRKGGEQWGTIVKEDDEQIVFLPQGSKSKKTIPRSEFTGIDRKGRPILVGTTSIEKSERLAGLLDRSGIKHEVLNAKHHKREAEIVAQAGRLGAVTIATNMAGRGTDIILGGNPETMAWAVLQEKYETRLDVPREEWDALVEEIEQREDMKEDGEKVKSCGGLHVIGTERHEARRIDLQLRGRCGRQGDPGSSRFYLSLRDDLMRIFAGPWVEGILKRLGMPEGDAIESRMVTRRIEAAQKKVEERNFEVRKNLLEYDEVMDEQRKRVYSYRQRILDGCNCKDLILEMVDEQVTHHLNQCMARDYGTETFATWAGSRLATDLDPLDFRGLDFPSAERHARDEAERMAETQVIDAAEENLPDDEDDSEWNWAALAKTANLRWSLNLRDRDLKKIGRENVAEFLIDKARESLAKVDLSPGADYLTEDFGLRTACVWVKHKFGIDVNPDDVVDQREGTKVSDLELPALIELIRERAAKLYEEKESEYPVMAGLYRFSTRVAGGQSRVDRQSLIAWARERFEADLELDDVRNKQRDDLRKLLVDRSRSHVQRANQVVDEIKEKLATLFASTDGSDTAALATGGNGALDSLSDWLRQTLRYDLPPSELARLPRDELERRLLNLVEDRFRPEIRRMERAMVLQLVDSAWKDHLLAMDHLRSAVGLVGYAQVDPKVEYKREGMKLFDQMWNSTGQRVTDLIFRMEQLDEGFVGSTWVETSAVHEEAPGASEIARQQQEAIQASQSGDQRLEPIRHRGERVGRNQPCPCGSGKKYKNCCMRTGKAVARSAVVFRWGKDVPMSYLLNAIYVCLLLVFSPWILWAAAFKGKYREGLGAKLLGRVPRRRTAGRCVWLHGVSVGEVNLIATLLKEMKHQLPSHQYVISTTTRSGYALARSKLDGHTVFYCPLDFSWAVSAAMRRVRPDLLLLAELELWPNLIASARRHGAKVIVVNGRLSHGSWRGYRYIRPLIAHVLRSLDLIAVQSQQYADRFRHLGASPDRVHVTGSLKFDGTQTERDNPRTRQLARLARVSTDDVVFLAGSTQSPEEVLALETYRRLADRHRQLRLILVPRHPERFSEVARMLDRSALRWQRRSQIDSGGVDSTARILLVDTIGELGAWWGTAHIAFVGGSLGQRGGQNMIEPAAYGAAVSFGPNTSNFRDVVATMLEDNAAVVVRDGNELTQFVARCLEDTDYRNDLGYRAKRLVQGQLGATAETVALIRGLLTPGHCDDPDVGHLSSVPTTRQTHGHVENAPHKRDQQRTAPANGFSDVAKTR